MCKSVYNCVQVYQSSACLCVWLPVFHEWLCMHKLARVSMIMCKYRRLCVHARVRACMCEAFDKNYKTRFNRFSMEKNRIQFISHTIITIKFPEMTVSSLFRGKNKFPPKCNYVTSFFWIENYIVVLKLYLFSDRKPSKTYKCLSQFQVWARKRSHLRFHALDQCVL